MNTLLMRVRKAENIKLNDDEFVEDCMTALMAKFPQVEGYTYERVEEFVHILMWGDIGEDDELPDEGKE